MKIHRFATALVAAMLLAPAVHAYDGCDNLVRFNERKRLRAPLGDALAAKRFAEVDRHFSRILAEMSAGRMTDSDAAFEFGLFQTDQPVREALHAEWIKTFPKSEAAHLAQARYFIERGWDARGEKFVKDTSKNQFAAMQAWFERGWASLDAAEKLSSHPTLEWAARMEVLRAVGGPDGAREAAAMYQKSITSYPSTVTVRISYVVSRAARWGGSAGEMQQVVAQARNLPEGDRRFVEAEANSQMGIDAQNYQGLDAAVPYYERAFALCPTYITSARRLVYAYGQKRDLARVIQISNRIIEQLPAHGESYADRAWALGNSGKFNEAFADYQRATQLGYAKAYLELAGFYQMGIGGAPRDLNKALELCTAAQDKGIADGKVCADRVRALMQRNP